MLALLSLKSSYVPKNIASGGICRPGFGRLALWVFRTSEP